jgi:hypothetical protein
MVVGAELRCFGVRLNNEIFLDLTYCKKLRNKFIWCERILVLHNQDTRAMLMKGEESSALKLEILCISRCHL